MRTRCVSTVFGLIVRRAAVSRVDTPDASSRSTCRSRGVSDSSPPAPSAPTGLRIAHDDAPDALDHLFEAGGLHEVALRAGAERLRDAELVIVPAQDQELRRR